MNKNNEIKSFFSTISYLKRGPRSAILEDPEHRIILKFPGALSPKKNGHLTVPGTENESPSPTGVKLKRSSSVKNGNLEAGESSSTSTLANESKMKRTGSVRSKSASDKISPKSSTSKANDEKTDLKRKSDSGKSEINDIKISKLSQEY